ncbi:hypothetical protein HX866_27395 [Pseudomonas gingeri]|uniref:alpha/beta fold hydrolase n=1 Tax=Pseudomonas gingeri TaxID=117681 RepID=UPI0015A01A70|nr:alpha/beta fold hydrolase [Pseudomonas gingeri]NWA28618.1 hypothetical protein [Pseudomonas gingeri]
MKLLSRDGSTAAKLLSMAVAALLSGAVSAAPPTPAQPTGPLILKDQGSFFIGGEAVKETPVQLSSPFGKPFEKGGTIEVNQMYVQYMVPELGGGVPVILVHGATLSGKTYETTPDGRMGWDEYFVRRGHPVYVPDQIGRARSGVDTATYNDVRSGVQSIDKLANVFRLSNEAGWGLFRFGKPSGEAFADEQFPLSALNEFSKQSVPDYYWSLPNPNPNYKALADLSNKAGGAVLMGHSQAGSYPLEAALTDSRNIKGLVLIEPGACGEPTYSEENFQKLAKLPILVVFGDHLDADTGLPGFSWQKTFEQCQGFIEHINEVGGQATMLHPPELGIHGNSHMLMQDRNNLQIADLILKWMHDNVKSSNTSSSVKR